MISPPASTASSSMIDQNPAPTNISPSNQMMQFIWPGAMAAQAIYVVAKLGIADLVVNEPKTAAELAEATATNSLRYKLGHNH